MLTKKGRPSFVNRPIQKLFPLEVSNENVLDNCKQNEEQTELKVQDNRDRRAAALDADFLRKLRS